MDEKPLDTLTHIPAFADALHLQQETVHTFYEIAREISGPDCPTGGIPEGMLDLRRNMFSTLFIAVTKVLVRNDAYMGLYAMVNQGMRAWVTACDNILDDEYKPIFDFDIPGQGPRMRSVLTIMLAERVVQRYVGARFGDPRLSGVVGLTSLQALLPSALQECEEENGAIQILPPEQLLREVHQRKTGDLFAAPLLLPQRLESPPVSRLNAARSALEAFGLACQIIDDIKDMASDVRRQRHNLLVSIIKADTGQWQVPAEGEWLAWEKYPEIVGMAQNLAQRYFNDSFGALGRLGISLRDSEREMMIALIYDLLGVARIKGEES